MSEFTADDEIRYPSGFGLADIVSWGTTGMVVLDESSNTVIRPWRPRLPSPHAKRARGVRQILATRRPRGTLGLPRTLRVGDPLGVRLTSQPAAAPWGSRRQLCPTAALGHPSCRGHRIFPRCGCHPWGLDMRKHLFGFQPPCEGGRLCRIVDRWFPPVGCRDGEPRISRASCVHPSQSLCTWQCAL